MTDMTVKNIDQRPNIIQELEANIPMRKLGDRRDLKGAVVLLLSEASAYTTGTDLCIDGGLVAH
jgi:NAD(P)-dependent dehydrogenase (short-subunit alcohol dehydrogenase family)